MNILFYLHFYFPEVGAASLRAQYFVKALEDAGHNVHVITPRPNYPAGKVYEGFEKGGFHVIKKENVTYLPIFTPNKQTLITRGISYLSYFLVSLLYTFFLRKNYDIIFSSSPPMSTAFSAVILSKIKKKPLLLDIRDLWPDIGIELKIINNPLLIRMLRRVDKFILKNSSNLIVPLDNFKTRLLKKKGDLKIETIFNGADTNVFLPKSEIERLEIKKKFGLPFNKKIFVYFGFFNFGMNDVNTLAEAITKLDLVKKDLHFLFIGGGATKRDFINKINSHVNYTFLNPLSPSEIAKILPACDLSIIPLKRIAGNTGGFIPVKCLESGATGVPVLLSSSGDDEIEKIFNESNGGFIIQAGDKDLLALKMMDICKMENLNIMGTSARQFVVENFDRKKQSEKLIEIIEELEK